MSAEKKYRLKPRNRQEARECVVPASEEYDEQWTRSECTIEGCVCQEMNDAVDNYRFWKPVNFIEKRMKESIDEMVSHVLEDVDDEYFARGWTTPKL